MPASRQHRSRLLACCVLAAAGMFALLLPSAARASCGDYVVVGNPSSTAQHAAHPMNVMHGAGTDSMPAVPQPCSGPRCSRLPSVPTPAPAPSTTLERSDDWGTLAPTTFLSEQNPVLSVCDSGPAVPAGTRLSIFHPPR